MRRGKSREVALLGLLFALVLALGFLENIVATALLLPPGVKPGLGNVVILFCLWFRSKREATVLVLLKSGFALLTRGGLAASLSAFGGFASLLLMSLLFLWMHPPRVLPISVFGALAHNFSQLFLFSLLLGGRFVWSYAPILLVAGLLCGGLTALLLRALLAPLSRMGLVVNMEQSPKKGKSVSKDEHSAGENEKN